MKRCVIVGGADINNYEYIKSCLHNDDFIVFCDSGLKHLEALQVKPGLIAGDFDSHDNPHLDIETIVLPCEKDDTDTVFAVKEAVKRGFDDFLLIGVVGAPLSHAVIVARELGIPAVVSCQCASGILKTGDRVKVDGTSGTVTILE